MLASLACNIFGGCVLYLYPVYTSLLYLCGSSWLCGDYDQVRL